MSVKLRYLYIIILCLLGLSACADKKKIYPADIDNDTELSRCKLDSSLRYQLYTIGKVWGYVKYHHPAFGDSYLDADKELFSLFSVFNTATCDTIDICSVLNEWLIDLGGFKSNEDSYEAYTDQSQYCKKVNLDWLADTLLIKARLAKELQSLRWAERSSNNRYVNKKGLGALNFNGEALYDKNAISNLNYRLLSLFRYWNIIEYFYPYKPPMWDTILIKYIDVFWNANSPALYTDAVRSLISEINDSHAKTNILNSSPTRFIPLVTRMIGDRLYLLQTDDSGGPSYSEILSIDGRSPRDLKAMLSDSMKMGQSNQIALCRDFPIYGMLTNNAEVSITLAHNGHISHQLIPTIDLSEVQGFLSKKSKIIPACQIINDSIGYINAGAFNHSDRDKYQDQIKNVSTLIFDMRFYPNNYMLFFLDEYILPHKTKIAVFMIPSLELPGYFKLEPQYRGKKTKHKFTGRIIVLVNENTISQGEYTTLALQAYKNTTVVGNMTAGTDGDVSMVFLPGNVQSYISGIGVLYPDLTPTQHAGIKIDYMIDPLEENKHYFSPKNLCKMVVDQLQIAATDS